jgi:CBS domain-containing protein
MMLVSDIIAAKGDLVVTIHPDVSLEHAAKQLTRFGFGVLMASEDGETICGILSERDIVRRIAEAGPEAVRIPVRSVMTRDVRTCTPTDTVAHVMGLMTEHRFRHVPVVDATEGRARLCGMVSITDVVRERVRELEESNHRLEDYLTAR